MVCAELLRQRRGVRVLRTEPPESLLAPGLQD